jgi:hypothetical protein
MIVIFSGHPRDLETARRCRVGHSAVSPTEEWAYAGVIFDLTGAVASPLASGFIDTGTLAYPILMMGVAVASWALRPLSRRLGTG